MSRERDNHVGMITFGAVVFPIPTSKRFVEEMMTAVTMSYAVKNKYERFVRRPCCLGEAHFDLQSTAQLHSRSADSVES